MSKLNVQADYFVLLLFITAVYNLHSARKSCDVNGGKTFDIGGRGGQRNLA